MRWILPWMVWALSALSSQAQASEQLSLDIELGAKSAFKIAADPENWEVSLSTAAGAPSRYLLPETPDPRVLEMRQSVDADGWHVMTFSLAQGFELAMSNLQDNNNLTITLNPVDGGAPRQRVRTNSNSGSNLKPLIVLDPGHGGIDSGAVRGDIQESELMLTFARELAEILVRSGRFRVDLTRSDDSFLRLSERIERARALQASAFVSLHADALAEGSARGAAVFTLSEVASDAAAAELVAAHDRADLLMGDHTHEFGDDVAAVLVDMAQRVNRPKSEDLSAAIVMALEAAERPLRKSPEQSANFGVLKAHDVPSVLIELGFMSDEKDLENLVNPEWRLSMAESITEGLIVWADQQEAAKLGRN